MKASPVTGITGQDGSYLAYFFCWPKAAYALWRTDGRWAARLRFQSTQVSKLEVESRFPEPSPRNGHSGPRALVAQARGFWCRTGSVMKPLQKLGATSQNSAPKLLGMGIYNKGFRR